MEQDKKKKKKKIKYNILLVPDAANEDVKTSSLSMRVVKTICIGVLLLVVVALVYCYYLTSHVLVANTSINSLRNEEVVLTEEKKKLTAQNQELQEKISILSDTITEKVQQEEARAAEAAKEFIPTGFPMKGSATYDESCQELDGQPIAMFSAMEGTSVIATATGKVSAIAGDDENGYIVMVDHENGYYSVYRNGSKPKVEEGQQITTETVIFIIQSGKEELGYQIIENDVYIDPLNLMEIYG